MNDEAALSEMAQVLATNLRALRLERKLTQADIAAAAGITRNHYQSMESARLPAGGAANPRLSTMLALAAVHDVPLAQLLTPPLAD